MTDLLTLLFFTSAHYYALVAFVFIMGEFEERKTFLLSLIPFFGILLIVYNRWKELD